MLDDKTALDRIQAVLSGREFNADTMDAIVGILADTGRLVVGEDLPGAFLEWPAKGAAGIGRQGGLARAAKLSPERRSEIASKAARTRWDATRTLASNDGTFLMAEFPMTGDELRAIQAQADQAVREMHENNCVPLSIMFDIIGE
jgi:hypothetical protein